MKKPFFKWCNLVRFGVYLDQILSLKNFKNDYFQVKIHINYSCTYMLGGSWAYASSLRKFCAVWCVLVYILIRLSLEIFLKN